MAGETDVRRKRLLYRSRRRGMREADHLLGGFAKRYLDGFTDEQLDRYERLLENGTGNRNNSGFRARGHFQTLILDGLSDAGHSCQRKKRGKFAGLTNL